MFQCARNIIVDAKIHIVTVKIENDSDTYIFIQEILRLIVTDGVKTLCFVHIGLVVVVKSLEYNSVQYYNHRQDNFL